MTTKAILILTALGVWTFLSSCTKENDPSTPTSSSQYVVAIRVPGNANVLTDYLLQTTSITSGTLSATSQGIAQQGSRTYMQVGNTIFSIGSSVITSGVPTALGYILDASSKLIPKGSVSFDKNFDVASTLDDTTLGGIQIPRTASENNMAIFYTANATNVSLTNKVPQSLAPLFKQDLVWPSGMQIRGNKAYVSYYLQNRFDYSTTFTDTAYVAIYSYPTFTLDKVIKDTRTGPAGSFNSNNGIFKTETGDLYTITSSGYTFSQRTKPAGFLRIKNGETAFDQTYFFNTDQVTSGYKIYYSQYVGNGLVLAEVGQFPATNGQWASDNVTLKTVIFDLNAKTVKDVTGGIPDHAGQGGVALSFLIENGKAYLPVTSYKEGTYIWAIDLATATATRGANVNGKYVTGIFKLN